MRRKEGRAVEGKAGRRRTRNGSERRRKYVPRSKSSRLATKKTIRSPTRRSSSMARPVRHLRCRVVRVLPKNRQILGLAQADVRAAELRDDVAEFERDDVA